MHNQIHLYTDGSHRRYFGRGIGGWAFIVTRGIDKLHEDSGHGDGVTNNHMELMAILRGLAFLKSAENVFGITDSTYCLKAIARKCLPDNKITQDEPNRILLGQIQSLLPSFPGIQFRWIKAHQRRATSCPHVAFNHACDGLAKAARLRYEASLRLAQAKRPV